MSAQPIVFSVLHYLVYEETVRCVDSVLSCEHFAGNKVVIVDNGSNNGSGEKLNEHYQSNDDVIVILNEKNEGFARGHNVGYHYAKEHLNPRAVVAMNNDLHIEQADCIDRLQQAIAEGWDLLGLDIVNDHSGKHQNPMTPVKSYRRELAKYKLIRWGFKHLPESLLAKVYAKKDGARQAANSDMVVSPAGEKTTNVQLQGACVIFANRFLEQESDAFDSRTFLYQEEDLLFQYAKRKGYTICFDPSVQVRHEGAVSSSAAKTDWVKRKIFTMDCHIQSCQYVIDDIKRYGRYWPGNEDKA